MWFRWGCWGREMQTRTAVGAVRLADALTMRTGLDAETTATVANDGPAK